MVYGIRSMKCPACSRENPPIERFCTACGVNLVGEKERSPAKTRQNRVKDGGETMTGTSSESIVQVQLEVKKCSRDSIELRSRHPALPSI